MIPPRAALRGLWAFHKALFRLSGGRLGTMRPAGNGLGTLFLVSTGRTSGQPRRNGLFYVDDGTNLVVVASNAGADADPGWWANLQANPEAEVQLGPARRPVGARRATADEAARLWPRFVAATSSYEEYRRKTTRPLPIVILEPR